MNAENTSYDRHSELTRIRSLAFKRALAPVFTAIDAPTAQAVAKYRGEPCLQSRVDQLARKANEGELTDAEVAEFRAYGRANRFLAITQAFAQCRIDGPNA